MSLEGFRALHPVVQALGAGVLTWAMTAAGAGVVFFVRRSERRVLDASLGFAAGVMIAASFWSLLAPAIALAEEMGQPRWLPALAGFLLGGVCIRVADRYLPHQHLFARPLEVEGVATRWGRTSLLVLAITLHNIPEGLAVGVAFAGAAAGYEGAGFGAAVALTIGIGLQNAPEGAAVALPLRAEGMGVGRGFWYGQLSAAVEPAAAVLGAAAVVAMRPLLPYALAFAAGAMLFVVVEEVIPESHRGGHTDLATLGAMGGFAVMMLLDVSLS